MRVFLNGGGDGANVALRKNRKKISNYLQKKKSA